MNIVVSAPYRPTFSSVAEQYEAERQVRLKRRQMQAMKPRLIEPPKVQLAERLKPRKKAKPVFKGRPFINHIKAYYHHQSLINPDNKAPDEASRFDIRDIKYIVLANSWELNNTKISAHFATIKELDASGRKREIVLARQVAMFISKKMTGKDLTVIGKHFGGRDHSTVFHAYDKILKAIFNRQLLMNGEPFTLERIGEI